MTDAKIVVPKLSIVEGEDENTFLISGALLSYFNPKGGRAGTQYEHNASLNLIMKRDQPGHKEVFGVLRERILKMGKEDLDVAKMPMSRSTLRDGDESGKPDYADADYLALACYFDDDTQAFPNSILVPVAGSDDWRESTKATDAGYPYSGCYCQVFLRLWAQSSGTGKDGQPYPARVNGTWSIIRKTHDGKRFGKAAPQVASVAAAMGLKLAEQAKASPQDLMGDAPADDTGGLM